MGKGAPTTVSLKSKDKKTSSVEGKSRVSKPSAPKNASKAAPATVVEDLDDEEDVEDDDQELQFLKSSIERSITSGKGAEKKKKQAAEGNEAHSAPVISTGTDFPRGGARALSALEFRQIKKQVQEEALFETQSEKPKVGKRKAVAKDEDTQVDSKRVKDDPDHTAARLTIRDLEPGTLVLGCVIEVTSFVVHVSLPGGLHGVIKLTTVSDAYLAALKEDTNDDEPANDASLSDFFHVNQLVTCAVLSVDQVQHKIELSTNPKAINKGLTAVDISKGSVLHSCIQSKEDHGYIVDFGIDKVSGFLPLADAKPLLAQLKRAEFFCG